MFLKRGFLYSVIFLLILLFTINIYAGTTGKITGRVIDKQSKTGLPGVNVIIPELGMGAATDAEGYYFILNVPVGTYTVQAQMITYATVTVENVVVNADIATTVNFELVPEAIQLEEITVTAKQKLVETNTTSKERTIDQQFLDEATGSGIMEVVATNAGVSGSGSALHVRGGRTDEVGYMVDGMSIVDPVTKGLGATINKNAVAEIKILTGGFNAEYGEAMSGVISVVTKEGGKSFNGSVKYEGNSFLWESTNFGSNRLELGLGGPIGTDKIRFFMSGDVFITKDWSPRFHDKPDYFYKNDSNGIAFEYTIIDSITSYYDSTLGQFVIDTFSTYYTWTQDSVPYFEHNTITLVDSTILDSVVYDSTAGESIYYYPTQQFTYVTIDTVIENRYGPSYWDTLDAALPHHKLSEYHSQVKFTVKPTNNIKINFGGFLSHTSRQSYSNTLKYNLENYLSSNEDGYQINTVINWMPNERNFVTLTGSYFYTQTVRAPEFIEPIYYYNDEGVLDSFVPTEPAIPEWYEFWKPYNLVDTTEFKELPNGTDKWRYNSPWGYWYSSLYRTQYIYPNYYGYMNYRFSSYYGVKGDWTGQIGRYHEVKAGIEYKQYHLFQWDLYLPWDPNPFEDNYDVDPYQAAAYIQDKMEFEGMIVNIGLRFDYLASNTPYLVDPMNSAEPLYREDTLSDGSIVIIPNTYDEDYVINHYPQADTMTDEQYSAYIDSIQNNWNIKIASNKYKFSPRLGISHPITETSVLHFNYGHFFQTPQMDYMFSGIGIDIRNRGNSLVGSPDLEAEKTIAYEVGIATQIGADMAIDLTTYYKDIYDLVGSRKVYAVPSTYYAFQNVEYGNVKGFEVSFEKSSKYFSANLAYTLSFAKGTASDAWEGYSRSYYYTDPVTGEGLSMPKIPYYLDFDRRHVLNLILTFRMPKGEMPVYADNWTLTFNNTIQSGTPYTPENLKGEITGTENSERKPWNFNTDMKFRKGFELGPISPNLYVQVSNLFNIKNVVDVYVTTGLPNTNGAIEASWSVTDFPTVEIGDPAYDARRDFDRDGVCTAEEFYTAAVTAYTEQLDDPTHYSSPRIVTVGFEFSF